MSSGGVNPIDNPQKWDVVRVGQTTSPGICKVGEFKRVNEWDVKKGKGSLGATVTYIARPPAKGSIVFKLWTATHFMAWDTFRLLFQYDPTKRTVQAVDIYHPALADINVNSVVCEEIGNIVHEGNQLYTITVALLEYFPPPKASAVSTPTGSKSNAGNTPQGNVADPVADAQQKQIAELMKQAASP